MGVIIEVARTGLTAITLHPLRSLVTVCALVAVLLPYLACLGISQGIKDQAEESVRFGADLFVTGRKFGRSAPVPLSFAEDLKQIPGVIKVVPRIVGGLVLGKDRENAVLVGMPGKEWPGSIQAVDGRLPEGNGSHELVMGSVLAKRLGLKVGSLLPPFYHNTNGEKVSRVVGVFKGEIGLWQSNLIFTTLETAEHLFNQQNLATDLLVYCRPGYEDEIAAALPKIPLSNPDQLPGLFIHVTTRSDIENLFRSNLGHREGVFQLHMTLAFIVAVLAILVTSGFGLPERRREIGILKATGWQTDEILLRSGVESFLLALSGISVSICLAFVWLNWLNGFAIASIFLTGVDAWPGFRVPYRLLPVPVLLSGLMGVLMTMTGTLYSSWRAAITPPGESMK